MIHLFSISQVHLRPHLSRENTPNDYICLHAFNFIVALVISKQLTYLSSVTGTVIAKIMFHFLFLVLTKLQPVTTEFFCSL